MIKRRRLDENPSKEEEAAMALKSLGIEELKRCYRAPELWACPLSQCPAQLKNLVAVRSHYVKMHTNQTFHCAEEDCQRTFTNELKYIQHLAVHERRERLLCTISGCGKRFKTRSNMRHHVKLKHEQEPKFVCTVEDCRSKFYHQKQLDIHMAKHEGVLPKYRCEEPMCDKTFITRNALCTHSRRHLIQEDELRCELCEKTFEAPCRLRAHLQTHSGQKPYACTEENCSWTFPTPSKLARHMDKHLQCRRYPCTFNACTKTFLRSDHLREHQEIHSRSQCYPCPVKTCDAKFSNRRLIRPHLRLKHDGDIVSDAAKILSSAARTSLTYCDVVQEKRDRDTAQESSVTESATSLLQQINQEESTLPAVQISTLVSCRERGTQPSERNLRAVARVGQAVNLAVERFVTVGETIGDDNHEIKVDMYEACKEAREAGAGIEKLCELEECVSEKGSVIRAARSLLAAITRVLLLADIVVVKQLLLAKDKVARSLGRLENVTNFTEFVKAFSQFGAEMVELAHLTGDRQTDTKDERRRAQMHTARQVLERSTMLLLVSSKTCLRHPDCAAARENRDTVFCQMRRAMDLIHYVVKDGVLDPAEVGANEDWEANRTVHGAMQRLEGLVQTALLAAHCQEGLTEALDAIIERSQDFTDSANTSHEDRERILELVQSSRSQLESLLDCGPALDTDRVADDLMATLSDLRNTLQNAAFTQAGELESVIQHADASLDSVRNLALAGDIDRVEACGEAFSECTDHVLEICKLMRHMAPSDSLQVAAKYTEINVRIYAPQVLTAASTLALYPTSKIAKENFEVFADMWQALVSDVATVTKEVIEFCKRRQQKQVYLSLPRPGKHGTTSKPLKAGRLDGEEQARIAKSGLEMKMATSEVEAEADKWRQDDNNDIVKRARNMSSMALSMYQFTKGEGSLKTTQDLFTQAEYFAEEANRLYKVARHFSYQVPAGAQKKELLESLSGVPTHVQQLQFTVKDPTVGKAATFSKVDTVIHEVKSLMNTISKVVTNCFVCCNMYNIDLRGLGLGSRGAGAGDDDGGAGGAAGGGDGKLGACSGTDGSI